MKHVIT